MVPMLSAARTMARRQARWSTAARRRFSQAATKGDKAGESTSTPTKWYVAGGVLAVAAPSYVVVSSLQSDPEMREQVQINYPDFYEFLHGVVPGGLEVVTYASIRASKSDWLEAHELPWGEGYDEDIPNVRATVITKEVHATLGWISASDRQREVNHRKDCSARRADRR